MKKIFNLFLLFSTFILVPLYADEVLATVNDEMITKKDVNEFVVKSIPGATFNSLNDVQKASVVNQMVERRLFLEDAKSTNLENDVAYQEALKKLQENLILDYWMKIKVEEILISEAEAKKYYFNNKEKFSKPSSVKVRHILLETEEEAVALIAALELSANLKEKFIRLAHAESTGPSAINGGELDWFVYEQMVPEFSEAAFGLNVGNITKQAVKTQFGYHIIYLENKKEKGSIAYKTVKEDIVKSLRLSRFKAKLDKLSKKLKKTANIIVK
ncbi:MAG: Peptidyl-prolyl cis-trans isomerase PpiC [uncultured Sulfurovum sp.]|uniref:Peptidyl-prolyl cis-trans isomerase PpiC n=1 Tax=uncultured Sulfurovum sp. TaxID=269237 RepID=A0A6S6U919_9BACT|nr:MAG: Peptidyl-prolyl cis-trans isomerase PpiC [uncultured Sulfurovum sp.]